MGDLKDPFDGIWVENISAKQHGEIKNPDFLYQEILKIQQNILQVMSLPASMHSRAVYDFPFLFTQFCVRKSGFFKEHFFPLMHFGKGRPISFG